MVSTVACSPRDLISNITSVLLSVDAQNWTIEARSTRNNRILLFLNVGFGLGAGVLFRVCVSTLFFNLWISRLDWNSRSVLSGFADNKISCGRFAACIPIPGLSEPFHTPLWFLGLQFWHVVKIKNILQPTNLATRNHPFITHDPWILD